MAHRRNSDFAAHLQMGSRLKTLVFLLLALTLAATPTFAATKKPTAQPTAKATAKATVKPSAKASASTKPSAKASSPAASKKPVVKKKKRAPRKKVKVSPSPKATWPPNGFSVQGEVYAKIPAAKELVGILSADASLATQVRDCEKFVCGVVQAGSETGCSWWEITTNLTAANNRKLGTLTSIKTSTKAQTIKTFLTVSPELVSDGAIGKVVAVACHHDPRDPALPMSEYKKSE